MTAAYDLRDATLERTTKFPSGPYALASAYWSDYLDELGRAANSIQVAGVERAAKVLVDAYTAGATVFSCGNGGSAAISNHLQCDHLKGVRTGTDITPAVMSLSANVELLTAIANDIGYGDVFIYQLQSYARKGDVLIAISSSGNSPNIIQALKWSRKQGVRTIALTGFEGGEARKVADVPIHVDSRNYGVIEDLHQSIMHALAQYVRQSRMSDDMVPLSTF